MRIRLRSTEILPRDLSFIIWRNNFLSLDLNSGVFALLVTPFYIHFENSHRRKIVSSNSCGQYGMKPKAFIALVIIFSLDTKTQN